MGGRYYRPDIDGLRAVAVLSVIAFHLNGAFPGGFVGVDIFFVISGYLIGGIVLGEVHEGCFSLARFYERRARRILPALLAVLLACAVAGWVLLAPAEIPGFCGSALAALAFVANIFFFETSGYFAPLSTEVPLLHLWSLGIEEQFYLIFPLLVMWLTRRSERLLTVLLLGAAVISLVLSEELATRHAAAAFYLLPSRAFELLIGALLAGVPAPLSSDARWAPWLGTGLVALALLLFKAGMPFPGLAALVPCAGSALLIWSGIHRSAARTALSFAPVAYLGRISYPLYLVHWPLIVFGRRVLPPGWLPLLVLAGGLLLAIVIHHGVERPVRYGRSRLLLGFACGMTAALLGVVVMLSVTTDAAKPPDLAELYLQGSCFLKPEQGPKSFVERCVPTHRPWALLVGDSHAAHLFHGLRGALDEQGYALGMLAASACPPIQGYRLLERPFCESINAHALDVIRKRRPDVVILSAMWKPTMMEGLARTLRMLLDQPGLKVVVVGNTPVFEESVTTYLGRGATAPIGLVDRAKADAALKDALREFDGRVTSVPLKAFTCPDGRCLLKAADGVAYYIDEGHLSAQGSEWIAKSLGPAILR